MIDPFHFINIAHAAEAANEVAAPSGGVLGLLGINFKLFIAQLVNFAIVLFILWKWVFTPITKQLQSRTASIEKSLKDAETTEKEKQEFNTWKKQEMAKARTEASGIVSAAAGEAESVKAQILAAAKAEQEKILETTKSQLKIEQEKAVAAVKTEVAGLVVSATEKILKQKLDPKKDKELIDEALKGIA